MELLNNYIDYSTGLPYSEKVTPTIQRCVAKRTATVWHDQPKANVRVARTLNPVRKWPYETKLHPDKIVFACADDYLSYYNKWITEGKERSL